MSSLVINYNYKVMKDYCVRDVILEAGYSERLNKISVHKFTNREEHID